jgi:hypothetical protein
MSEKYREVTLKASFKPPSQPMLVELRHISVSREVLFSHQFEIVIIFQYLQYIHIIKTPIRKMTKFDNEKEVSE